MDPARQREIASRGGRAAHAKGTAHEWSADEARSAGRKGGEVVSRDREHMETIGRAGGEARGRARRQVAQGNGVAAQKFQDRERAVTISREVPAYKPRPSGEHPAQPLGGAEFGPGR